MPFVTALARSRGRTCRTEKSFAGALVIADDDGEGFTEGEEGCFRVDAVENKSGVVNRVRSLLTRMILLALSFAAIRRSWVILPSFFESKSVIHGSWAWLPSQAGDEDDDDIRDARPIRNY